MASRIKGITVEIGGDTTGLDKALKNVNATIRSTQSSLKDVNKLLKLDPANTELLAQKQKLLKDAKLVRFRREGKIIFYSLDDDHVRTILSMGMEHIEER